VGIVSVLLSLSIRNERNIMDTEAEGWRKRQIQEYEPRWREWRGLTVEEIEAKADESRPATDFSSFYAGARWAEFKLKERNCG
jgi:hypothetical protein